MCLVTEPSLTSRSRVWATRLPERCADRLEDRGEHVLWILAFQQADVQVEPRRLDELAQELRRDVVAETADPQVGEVDVGDQQRPLRPFERRRGERLVGGDERPAASGVEPLGDCAAEGAPGGRDRLVGTSKRALRASSPTRWSSTVTPVATFAAPSAASVTRTPVCVSAIAF
jgi:hypothetical protein